MIGLAPLLKTLHESTHEGETAAEAGKELQRLPGLTGVTMERDARSKTLDRLRIAPIVKNGVAFHFPPFSPAMPVGPPGPHKALRAHWNGIRARSPSCPTRSEN